MKLQKYISSHSPNHKSCFDEFCFTVKLSIFHYQGFFRSSERPKSNLISVMEGFETVMFRSKFDSWPTTSTVAEPRQGRGKVAGVVDS